MEAIVNVPEEGIGRIIGKGGEVRRLIEKMGGVKVIIKGGIVKVTGDDSLKIMKASDVIRAIALGFDLYDAFELFRDDTQLASFNIEEALPNSAGLERQISRIIGSGGRAKKFFEKKLGVHMLVKGGKVHAIGEPEKLEILREAIEKLVHGSPHASVYRFVERRLASLENF